MAYQVYIVAFAANLASFMGGTAITWSSPTVVKLNSTSSDENPLGRVISTEESSWISSLAPLGAIFGPFLFGYLSDKIGRKLTILILAIPFLISHIILAFAETIALYYFSRVFIGIGLGGIFTVIPMYVGEISEDSNRGVLGSFMVCFLCAGELIVYCIGPYISILCFNVILAVIPVVFMVLFFMFGPESPYYYVSKNREVDAEKSLNRLRKATNDEIGKEMLIIKETIEKSRGGKITDLFQSKGLIKALIISIGLIVLQQFSGINAVLFYAQTIFQDSGSNIRPEVCSIICGAVQLACSLVVPLFIDRLGRKLLLLISAAGMFISEIPLGVYFYLKSDNQDVSSISWLPIVTLVCYIITYSIAFGSIPWAIMGEIFPPNVKSIASSLTASICWVLGFLITKFFQQLSDAIGMGEIFWLFGAVCFIAFFFTLFCVMETKGKSLQEIQDALGS